MRCPQCSNSYAKSFSKCPECQCWLIPSGPKAGKAASPKPKVAAGGGGGNSSSQWGWEATPSDGWLQGNESQSGWATPQSQSGWLGGSAPDPAPQQNGWLGGGAPDPEPQQSGWHGGGAPDPEPQQGRGWLGDPPAEEPGHATSDESIDEQWLEEENWDHRDVEDYDAAPPAAPPSSGGGFFKLLVLTLVSLVAVGLVAVNGGFSGDKPTEETAAVETVDPAEALETGRLFLESARKSMEAKQFDAASLQLKSALPHLNDGNCPQDELNEAYIMLAHATLSNDELLISRDLWAQLGDNIPSLQAEAATRITQADKGLRLRAERLLQESEADLKKGRDNAALRKSREALNLFEDFDGTNDQIGRAHGLLGKAYLAKLVKPSARLHLLKAQRFSPNPEYTRLLNQIGGPGNEPVDDPAPPQPHQDTPTVVPVSSNVPTAPVAGRPRPRPRPAKPTTTSTTQTATSSAPKPSRMVEVPAYQAKTDKRRSGQKSATNTQFVNYTDRTKK